MLGGAGEILSMFSHDAADAEAAQQRLDRRCANADCELFQLKLERDEVTATPQTEPDRCAACGQFLEVFDPDGA
jgi:hypothetical protein